MVENNLQEDAEQEGVERKLRQAIEERYWVNRIEVDAEMLEECRTKRHEDTKDMSAESKMKNNLNSEQGEASIELFIVVIALAIIFISGIAAYLHQEREREQQARKGKAVVLETKFAPASSSSSPIYISGDGGVMYPLDLGSSTQDRWIIVVKATEGATGIRAIDVSKNLYYRIKPGQELTLIIERGDLADPDRYEVTIDESALPAPFDEPSPGTSGMAIPRENLTNAKGQVRR